MRLSDLKQPIEQPLKVIFVGPSGARKSSCAVSWPGKKYVLDFDSKIYSLYDRNLESEDLTFDSYAPYDYEKAFKRLEELKKRCPYDVVIADSYSSYGIMSMNYSRQMRGTGEKARVGKAIGVLPMNEIQDFGAAHRATDHLMDILFSLPCNVIVICHLVQWEQTIIGDGPARIKYHSKVVAPTSAIAALLPSRFNDVWGFRLESGMDGENAVVVETTGASGNELLRTALKLPSTFEVKGADLYGKLKDMLSVQSFGSSSPIISEDEATRL